MLGRSREQRLGQRRAIERVLLVSELAKLRAEELEEQLLMEQQAVCARARVRTQVAQMQAPRSLRLKTEQRHQQRGHSARARTQRVPFSSVKLSSDCTEDARVEMEEQSSAASRFQLIKELTKEQEHRNAPSWMVEERRQEVPPK